MVASFFNELHLRDVKRIKRSTGPDTSGATEINMFTTDLGIHCLSGDYIVVTLDAYCTNTTADDVGEWNIKLDGTIIQPNATDVQADMADAGGDSGTLVTMMADSLPTSGPHLVQATARRQAGTGSIQHANALMTVLIFSSSANSSPAQGQGDSAENLNEGTLAGGGSVLDQRGTVQPSRPYR